MTIGKKRNEQLFHDWIEDMLNDLNLHSYSYEVADLKLQHRNMLWKIFDEYIDGGFSSSEQQIACRTHLTSFTPVRYSYGKSHIQQPCRTLAA